jgi:hypothetical protein
MPEAQPDDAAYGLKSACFAGFSGGSSNVI